VADVALLEVVDRVATVTLNRPEARNALSSELRHAIPAAVARADADPEVAVVILTGADPAFCAGLDLKELGRDGGPLQPTGSEQLVRDERAFTGSRASMLPTTKPVIGAINGVAVTGGLELALHCDFLVASELARFADTHARIGVQPAWGMTVLLPQAIGIRRAREMSTTGNFVDAATALTWGLVNHVVPHDELLPFARRLAADIASNDPDTLRTLLATYDEGSRGTVTEAWQVEGRAFRAWQRDRMDPAEIERRRLEVVERGRTQV
jgi:enoyl-CoA hydratase/carnithine racemase